MSASHRDRGRVFDDPYLIESWLPAFDSVVALTTGSAMEMSETGGYARPQRKGEDLVCDPHRISVRLMPERMGRWGVEQVDDAEHGQALTLLDRDGRVIHVSHVSSPDDLARMDTMTASAPQSTTPREIAGSGRRASAAPSVGAQCATWSEATTSGHLDAVLEDGGRARLRVLPRLGQMYAERVDVEVALHGLVHVHLMELPITVVATRPGLFHARTGPIDDLRQSDTQFSMGLNGCTATIDVEAVDQVWVTRPNHGPATIEIYDADGECVGIMTQTGRRHPFHAARWDHLAEMICIS